jgi:hypothetical protein
VFVQVRRVALRNGFTGSDLECCRAVSLFGTPACATAGAGIYPTTFRAAHDALTPDLHTLLEPLGNTLSAHARPGSSKGPGLLDGDAGCSPALTTLTAHQVPTIGWDACLLIN